MPLHAAIAGHGPRVVLVHGFSQTGACWGVEADNLARDHEVCRVDAPGHGASSSTRADLDGTAALLAEAGGAATYLGYSMGARMCLTTALAHPDLVRGLVMVGGTAGIADPEERAARRAQDQATADALAVRGLDAFLNDWLDQPLFRSLPSDRSFPALRLTNSIEGLQSSLLLAGTGAQQPSWDRLQDLEMPVLAIAGAMDEKFSALARRMVDMAGDNASLVLIDGAGHAAHLEQPEAFLAALRPWLAEHEL